MDHKNDIIFQAMRKQLAEKFQERIHSSITQAKSTRKGNGQSEKELLSKVVDEIGTSSKFSHFKSNLKNKLHVAGLAYFRDSENSFCDTNDAFSNSDFCFLTQEQLVDIIEEIESEIPEKKISALNMLSTIPLNCLPIDETLEKLHAQLKMTLHSSSEVITASLDVYLKFLSSSNPLLVKDAFKCLFDHLTEITIQSNIDLDNIAIFEYNHKELFLIASILSQFLCILPNHWLRYPLSVLDDIINAVFRNLKMTISLATLNKISPWILLSIFDPCLTWLKRWLVSNPCRKTILKYLAEENQILKFVTKNVSSYTIKNENFNMSNSAYIDNENISFYQFTFNFSFLHTILQYSGGVDVIKKALLESVILEKFLSELLFKILRSSQSFIFEYSDDDFIYTVNKIYRNYLDILSLTWQKINHRLGCDLVLEYILKDFAHKKLNMQFSLLLFKNLTANSVAQYYVSSNNDCNLIKKYFSLLQEQITCEIIKDEKHNIVVHSFIESCINLLNPTFFIQMKILDVKAFVDNASKLGIVDSSYSKCPNIPNLILEPSNSLMKMFVQIALNPVGLWSEKTSNVLYDILNGLLGCNDCLCNFKFYIFIMSICKGTEFFSVQALKNLALNIFKQISIKDHKDTEFVGTHCNLSIIYISMKLGQLQEIVSMNHDNTIAANNMFLFNLTLLNYYSDATISELPSNKYTLLGLKVLNLLVTDLTIYLYLETKFSIQNLLFSILVFHDGNIVIDEISLMVNHILIRTYLLGGSNERQMSKFENIDDDNIESCTFPLIPKYAPVLEGFITTKKFQNNIKVHHCAWCKTFKQISHSIKNNYAMSVEEKIGFGLTLSYGTRLGMFNQNNIQQGMTNVLNFVNSVEDNSHFNFFVASIFTLTDGNEDVTIGFLKNYLSCYRSLFIWPDNCIIRKLKHIDQINAIVLQFVNVIVYEQLHTVYNAFLRSNVSVISIYKHWLKQCFWNFLNWDEISNFLFLIINSGSDYCIYFFVAVLKHLQSIIMQMSQQQHLMFSLRTTAITDFELCNYTSYIDFIAKRYQDKLFECLTDELQKC